MPQLAQCQQQQLATRRMEDPSARNSSEIAGRTLVTITIMTTSPFSWWRLEGSAAPKRPAITSGVETVREGVPNGPYYPSSPAYVALRRMFTADGRAATALATSIRTTESKSSCFGIFLFLFSFADYWLSQPETVTIKNGRTPPPPLFHPAAPQRPCWSTTARRPRIFPAADRDFSHSKRASLYRSIAARASSAYVAWTNSTRRNTGRGGYRD